VTCRVISREFRASIIDPDFGDQWRNNGKAKGVVAR
jgi:hypothetical protein